MALIKPFKAIRPDKKYADMVAELPYDVMNRDEAIEIAKNNNLSFLHIDRSEIDLPKEVNAYDEKVYLKAKENLDKFISNKIFLKEEKDCLYIYREIMDDRIQTGIVACVSVEESLNGKIKKHEYTKPDKEKDRTNHIKYCNANTGTILLTYKNKAIINKIIDEYTSKENPLYDFYSKDKVKHTVWRIEDIEIINKLVESFKSVPYLYIADGHHRAASAENVYKKMKNKCLNYTGNEEFNYYLAMIVPDNELNILDYNRVIKDLNNLSEREFMEKVKKNFSIEEIKENLYKPEEKGCFGMYLSDKCYKLKVNENILNQKDIIKTLDVNILHEYIINPILGIENPRSDDRIDFVGGIRGNDELKKRVNDDMAVAFSLYPTSMKELMAVADENKMMPAKSTWFEPKVRCGLFLHEL